MKRRDFVEKLGIGSVSLAAAGALGSVVPAASGSQAHDHATLDGPLASATVVFGSWIADPLLDRFPNNSPRTANNHKVRPTPRRSRRAAASPSPSAGRTCC